MFVGATEVLKTLIALKVSSLHSFAYKAIFFEMLHNHICKYFLNFKQEC